MEILSSWILIIAIVGLVFLVMKIANKKQELAVKSTLAIFTLLAISMGYVYIKSGFDLTSFEGVKGFAKLYLSWLQSAFSNVKTITANAIKLNWGI
jgi:hypothetical protein